jgi:hypothetical protein
VDVVVSACDTRDGESWRGTPSIYCAAESQWLGSQTAQLHVSHALLTGNVATEVSTEVDLCNALQPKTVEQRRVTRSKEHAASATPEEHNASCQVASQVPPSGVQPGHRLSQQGVVVAIMAPT